MLNLPKKPGVYLLTCKKNGKVYVGEGKNIYWRINYHHRKCSRSKDPKIKSLLIVRAITKHDWKNFDVEVLHEFDDPTDKTTLLALETAFIDFYDCLSPKGYNVCLIGNDRTGKKMSKEAIAKRVAKMTGRKRPPPITEEWRQNLIKSTKRGVNHYNYGKKLSLETLKKASESHKKQKRTYTKIKQIDPKTNEIIKIWSSVKEIIKFFGFGTVNSIRRVCNKGIDKRGYRRPTAYGFKWEYISRYSEEDRLLDKIL